MTFNPELRYFGGRFNVQFERNERSQHAKVKAMADLRPELILGVLALVAALVMWLTSRRDIAWRWASVGTLLWGITHMQSLLPSNFAESIAAVLGALGVAAWLIALRGMDYQEVPRYSLLTLPLMGIQGLVLYQKTPQGLSPEYGLVMVQIVLLLFSLPLIEAALSGRASEARLVWVAGLLLQTTFTMAQIWLGPSAEAFINYVALLSYLFLALGAYLELRALHIDRVLLGLGLLGLLVGSAILTVNLIDNHHLAAIPSIGVWSYTVLLILSGLGFTIYNRIVKAERRLELWVNLLETLSTKPQSTQNLAPQGVLETVLDGLSPLFNNLVGLEIRNDIAIKAGQGGPYIRSFELSLDNPTEARLYFTSPPQDERGLEALAPLLTERLRLSVALNEWRSKAYSDPLTGLLNRRGFERQVQRLIRLSQESRKPISVALLDLDRFKKINDTFGHPVGDKVLKELAALLKKFSRNDDLAVRFGGEEFGLIMFGANLEDAHRVIERVRQEIKTVQIPPVSWEITLSGGIAGGEAPSSMGTVQRWLEYADKALYKAKQAGRDRIYAASPTQAKPKAEKLEEKHA